MVNYSQGKIYKLVHPSTDLVYVGSTCEPSLARRLALHRGNYRAWKKGNQKKMSAFQLFELGIDEVKIVLVKSYPCESRDELNAKEEHYRRKLSKIFNVCNINKCHRTKEDKLEYWRHMSRKQYDKHKELINEKNKAYYCAHQDACKARVLSYFKGIREECPCGGSYNRYTKENHMNTAKHQDYEDDSD